MSYAPLLPIILILPPARRAAVGMAQRATSLFTATRSFYCPAHAFVPFWVDGAGYWLILMGEPLLNNPALVELPWGLKQAGTCFSTPG